MFTTSWSKWLHWLRTFPAHKERRGRKHHYLTVEHLEDRVVPSASNQQYVTGLYGSLFQRAPDSAGLNRWTTDLDNGQSPVQVVASILGSKEFEGHFVSDLYHSALRRDAKAGELSFWTDALTGGESFDQVEAAVYGSGEYFGTRGGGTKEGFLQSVYQDLLHRPVDTGGLNFYRSALNTGAVPNFVAQAVLTSSEGRFQQVSAFYDEFLVRAAAKPELVSWVLQFQLGIPTQQVMADIAGSPEAYKRFAAPAAQAVPPSVVFTSPLAGSTAAANPTVRGQVTSRLDAVAALQVQVDAGAFTSLAFDAAGQFAYTPTLPLDGSADGEHAIDVRTINAAGVVTNFSSLPFTLQSQPAVNGPKLPGRTANETFVISLYNLLLGRPPEDAGLKYWAAKLDGGEPTTRMLQEFQASDEYRNQVIRTLYPTYLRRPATTQEVNDRRNYLAQGHSVDQLKADILGSDAYFQNQGHGTNDGFLKSLYPDVLGRQLDDTNRADLLAKLSNGESRVAVALEVLTGDEARVLQIEKFYQQYLGRDADPVGLVYWSVQFRLGLPAEQIAGGIAGSPESYTHNTQAARPVQSPLLTITTPTDGLLTRTNTTVAGQITGDLTGVAALQYQTDGGAFANLAFDPASGKFSLPTTLALDGSSDATHTVRVRTTDASGTVTALSSVAFTLDTRPPVVTITGPTNYVGAASPTVTGTVTDLVSGVATLTAQIDGGASAPVSFNAAGAFSFQPAVAAIDGPHTLSLQATDRAGNVATAASLTFTLQGVSVLPTSPSTPRLAPGQPGSANATSTATPTVLVDAVAGDSVTLFVNGTAVDRQPATSGTARFALAPLADGIYTLTAAVKTVTATSAPSGAFTLAILTKPPQISQFGLSSADTSGTANQTTAARVTLVGQTGPNVQLALTDMGITALSGVDGKFQFPNVTLAVGDNPFVLQATDAAGNAGNGSVTVTRAAAGGQPNAVLVWNQATLNAIQHDGTDPLFASRGLAMVQSAVYDAVNAIAGTPAYYVKITAPAGASAPAAVDAAAHDVLNYLYPAQQTTFDALLVTQLGLLSAGQSMTDGEAVGQAAGDAIIALRANDGSRTFVAYTPGTAAGTWQETAPSFAPAFAPQWANLTPFALATPDQFRPAGPPALSSQQWADAVNEAKSLGAVKSTTRTADQTQIAQFWNDGGSTYSPPGHWNAIAQTVAQQQGDSLLTDARLFAALDISLADAGITAWNTKYDYATWRPITVLRDPSAANNPNVTADPTWTPLLTTPNFPEYVSGHSTFSGAAATVLDTFFGANVSFTSTEVTLAGVQRSFTSFDQAALEAGRSRIYAGIHFEFSDADGLAAGKNVANYVLTTFDTSRDTTPPRVSLDNTAGAAAGNKNVPITGKATDTLSGVAKLEVQVDQGTYAPLSFDGSTGKFAFATTFKLDGSDDKAHTLSFRATDGAGNVATPVAFAYTLATAAPTLAVAAPADNGTLAAGASLTGSATAHGAALVALNYAFDGGATMPLSYNADGSFSQALDQSKLAAGAHTLTLTATDAAGNTAAQTLHLSLTAAIALQVTSLTPAAGATDVGVTFRPKVTFSRPINTATLTGTNFFATDTTGAKLDAAVVPSADGTFAWLFFTNPMPSASVITVTVDGSTIMAADGALLDAADNNIAGSKLTSTFTTVSTVAVAGTTLSGIIADPGPDLKPMNRDDVRNGPDGILGTADDVYLRPIQGVKVYILGHEDQAVYTDSQGKFTFTSVPSGDVKLGLEGNVAGVQVYDADAQKFVDPATQGFYFPVMVMDLTVRAGVANTVMGSMGTTDQQAANATSLGVYLPRVQSCILQAVDATKPTTLGVTGKSAPDLTPQQQQELKLTVQPGTLVGMDGQMMSTGTVGISTVPASIVMDMLPAGVLQHTFDITIQAPGVATFSTPAQLTFPNVFNAAPGTQLNLLSFDHTTGRLEIDGTATVSADGLTVTTDPGNGVTHPGWHGLTPPGDCGNSGGPPPAPPPPPAPTDKTKTEKAIVQPLYSGHGLDGEFALSWDAPNRAPTDPPPPPPDPKCPTPPRPPKTDPTTTITIDVDGPLSDFTQPGTNSLPLSGTTFTLEAGSGEHKKFEAIWRSTDDMFKTLGFFGGGIKSLDHNILFGSKITVTTITVDADGNKNTDIQPYYLYRFIDATDADPLDQTMSFEETAIAPGVQREKLLQINTGSAQPQVVAKTNTDFVTISGGDSTQVEFIPKTKGQKNDSLQITAPDPDHQTVPGGGIKLQGTGRPEQQISLDMTGLEAALVDFSTNFDTYANAYLTLSPGVVPKARFQGLVNDVGPDPSHPLAPGVALATAIKARVVSLYSGFDVVINDATVDATASVLNVYSATDANEELLGRSLPPAAVDLDKAGLTDYFNQYKDHNAAWQGFKLDQYLNQTEPGSVKTILGSHIFIYLADNKDAFVNNIGDTIAHEDGHNLGLSHPWDFKDAAGKVSETQPDIMGYAADNDAHLAFTTTYSTPVLKLDLKGSWTSTDVDEANAILLRDLTARRFGGKTLDGSSDGPDITLALPPGPHVLVTFNDASSLTAGLHDVGTATVGSTNTTTLNITNVGDQDLSLSALQLGGSAAFSLAAPFVGKVLHSGETLNVAVKFSPNGGGLSQTTVSLKSNDLTGVSSFVLQGHGQAAAPTATIASLQNNLGGTVIDTQVTHSSVVTLRNDGVNPLIISAITLVSGSSNFSLTNVPANLGTTPITLAAGQTFSIDAAFKPGASGPQRALIAFTTNDPVRPQVFASLVGNGLDKAVHWAHDYVAIEFPNLPAGQVIRTVSDDNGDFSFFLPPKQDYHISIFDPITGLIAHGYGTTPASGRAIDLTADLVFGASTAKDTDGDGLPDDVEFTIGTNPNKASTAGDGIDDYTHVITDHTNPLGGKPVVTGVVSSLALQGQALAVTLQGSANAALGQTAYVATGTYGLAIVNASDFQKPALLSQLPLSGTSTDVSVDANLQIAAVASNAGGLNLIDVSNPLQPKLLNNVRIDAAAVRAVDGVAYAAVGAGVRAFDELTGTFLQKLDLGGGTITALAREGSFLYTIDAGNTLHVLDVSGPTLVARGSLALPASGGKLFVAGGIAYLGAGNGQTGGFVTASVTDPDHPVLLSGVKANNIGGTDVVANGSGIAVDVGSSSFGRGGFQSLDLVDVSDPTNTGVLITRIDLPAPPSAVALGSGIAFVADGASGLQVVNYLAFDTKGVAPTLSISTLAGAQVAEGTTIPVAALLADDVQVRNVELLVNGKVVRNDVAFPFDLSVTLPTLAQNGSDRVTVQVRATDTGGNVALSNLLPVQLVKDATAPTLVNSNVANGQVVGTQFRTISLFFSKSMDEATLTPASVTLAGPKGTVTPQNFQFRDADRYLQVTVPQLDVGSYQVILDATAIKDRAGNALGAGQVKTTFQVKQYSAVFTNAAGGNWDDPTNWDTGAVPGPTDDVLIDVPGGATITFRSGTAQINSLVSNNPFTITGGTLEVNGTVKVNNTFLLNGGTLRNAQVLNGSGGQGLKVSGYYLNPTLDNVLLGGDLDLSGASYSTVSVLNRLTLGGTVKMSYGDTLSFTGQQTLDGTGTVELNNSHLSIGNGAQLTLGAGVTVEGAGTVDAGAGTLINRGTLAATTATGMFAVAAGTFQNQGKIQVANGSNLTVSGLTGDLGAVSIAGANSQLSVTGTNYTVSRSLNLGSGQTLSLLGTWTAAAGVTLTADGATLGLGSAADATKAWTLNGAATVKNGTLNLGGSSSSLANLTLANSSLAVVSTYTFAQVKPLLTGGNKLAVGSGGVLDNTGGTLNLDATTGSLTLNGGKLKGGTVTAAAGTQVVVSGSGSVVDGVILNSDLDLTASTAALTVEDGLTLNGTARVGAANGSTGGGLSFSGNQTFDGTAAVTFGTNTGNYVAIDSSTTLTISANVTIGGGAGSVGGSSYYATGTLVNQGTILASSNGVAVRVNVTSLTNNGTLQATNGGSLSVTGLTGGLGTITFSGAKSKLSLNGTNYTVDSSLSATNGQTLSLLGSWTLAAGQTVSANGATLELGSPGAATPAWINSGAITAANATVNLGGKPAALGTLTVTNSTLNVVGAYTVASIAGLLGGGNKLAVGSGGVLDNTGGTLTRDATTGSLTLNGGTLKGGTVTATGGANVVVKGNGGLLDGVTLNSDLDLTSASASLTFQNGLTLNGTASIGDLGGAAYSSLTSGNTQTLGGTGAVKFGGNGSNYLQTANSTTLTLGSGITVSGSGSFNSNGYYVYGTTLINQGTITADGKSMKLNVNAFQNAGTLTVANGGSLVATGLGAGGLGTIAFSGANSVLSLDGTGYTVDTSFSISNGQTLSLLGSWTAGAGVTLTADHATLGLGSLNGSTQAWSAAGSVTATNSTVNLGGKPSSVGTLSATSSTINVVGSYTISQISSFLSGSNTLTVGSGGVLDNTGGTIALNATTGSLTLAGGTLKGGTVNASGGAKVIVTGYGSTLDGVTLNADLDLTAAGTAASVVDGLTLNGTATLGKSANSYSGASLQFNTSQTLGGTGSVVFASGTTGNQLYVNSGVTLTIGAGVTIHGGNATVGAYGSVVNNGTIAADIAGATIAVNATTFTNAGTLQVSNGGNLSITGMTGNLGTVPLGGSGSLSVNGTNYTVNSSLAVGTGQTLSLLGTWTAGAGVAITVSNATLHLGSTTSLAALSVNNSTIDVEGSYTVAQIQSLGSGNKIQIGPGGVLDNTGNTLTLSAATGSLTLAGGTLKGGTVNASGGSKVVVTGSGSTLDGVTLNADLDLTAASASANVVDGLTLNGTATLGNTANSYSVASLTFNTTQTLDGTGSVVFANATYSNQLVVGSSATLTIGAGITIHGGNATIGYTYGTYGTVVNNGTIAADVAGATITLNTASFTNAGTLRAANGGSLAANGLSGSLGTVALSGVGSNLSINGTNYTVGSSLSIGSGQTLSLLGTWTAAAGVAITVSNATLNLGNTTSLAALAISNATLNVQGTYTFAQLQSYFAGNKVAIGSGGVLDNTGNTLTLTAAIGSLTLAGGTLKGGVVTATGGPKVVVTGYGSTLDGVTLNADLDLTAASASASVANGLTLNGTATLGGAVVGSSSTLTFSTTETLGGTGSVVFAGGGGQLAVGYAVTLTIGAGITVHGGTGTIGSYSYAGTVVNKGTISADVAGATLSVDPATFTNAGTLRATNGGSLAVSGLTGNLGTVAVTGSGSNLSFNGTNYSVGSSLAIGSGQTLDLFGTWTAAAGVAVTVNGGTFGLGNTTSLAALALTNATLDVQGTYTFAQLQPLFAGNKVEIGSGGVLDNSGNTLTLTAATGSLTLAGGTLKGGTVNAGGGAKVVVTGYGNTLDGVTLNADLDLTAAGSSANVVDGLTLNGTATLGNSSMTPSSGLVYLSFNTSETLSGTGSVVLASNGPASQLSVAYNATLTIGAGITIHGANATIGYSYGNYGTIINNGTISADVAGAALTVNTAFFTNAGTLQATNGGSLSVSGITGSLGTTALSGSSNLSVSGTNYTVGNSLGVGSGQILSLLGTWTAAAGVTISVSGGTFGLGNTTSLAALSLTNATLDVQGTYTFAQLQSLVAGNKVEIGSGGVLDNTGNTLTLTAATGSLTLAGGTLKGGTVNASGGAKVVVTGSGSTLDGVILNADLDLTAASASASVTDGLTFNGTATLGGAAVGSGANLTFNSTETLGGTGSIVFAGGGAISQLGIAYNTTLTIGAGITIHGGKANIGYGYGTYGNIVNNGTIAADLAGATITVNPASFTNAGTLQATNGGGLSVSGIAGSLGTFALSGSGSSLSFNGTNYTVGSSVSVGSGQTLSLLGTWTAAAGVTVSVTGGTFGLATTTSLAALSLTNATLDVQGTYTLAQLQSLVAGNKIEIGSGGVLDNTGNTLTLTATTGSLTLAGGTLKGGTVNASGGAKVVVVTGADSTLDGVTLNADLDLTATGASATVVDGLTLNGTASIGAASLQSSDVPPSILNFVGTESLAGNATVVFGAGHTFVVPSGPTQNALTVSNAATLTLAATVTVRGDTGEISAPNSGLPFTLLNLGTIAADVANGTVTLNPRLLTNQGTLQASGGGSLVIGTSLQNSGTVSAGVGSTVTVNGGLTQNNGAAIVVAIGGAAANQAGAISVTASANFAGTLTATFVGGFTPTAGSKFQVITFGSKIGSFASVIGQGLPNGLNLTTTYDPADVKLTVN